MTKNQNKEWISPWPENFVLPLSLSALGITTKAVLKKCKYALFWVLFFLSGCELNNESLEVKAEKHVEIFSEYETLNKEKIYDLLVVISHIVKIIKDETVYQEYIWNHREKIVQIDNLVPLAIAETRWNSTRWAAGEYSYFQIMPSTLNALIEKRWMNSLKDNHALAWALVYLKACNTILQQTEDWRLKVHSDLEILQLAYLMHNRWATWFNKLFTQHNLKSRDDFEQFVRNEIDNAWYNIHAWQNEMMKKSGVKPTDLAFLQHIIRTSKHNKYLRSLVISYSSAYIISLSYVG